MTKRTYTPRVIKPTSNRASTFSWLVTIFILIMVAFWTALSWGAVNVFHESVMRCPPESKLVDCFVPTLVIHLKK